MKKLFYIMLLLSLSNCIKNKPTYSFTNKSNYVIDSLIIYTDKKCTSSILKNIKKGDTVDGEITFCNNSTNDGSYGIKFFSNGKLVKQTAFGYFTNGGSLNSSFELVLSNDNTLLVNEN